MDVIRYREMRELLIECDEAGAIEQQRIGCGEPAIEDIVILHGAALGKEDIHFFNKMLFQRQGLPGVFQQRCRRGQLADSTPRVRVEAQVAAKGERFDVFVAYIFNIDLARADTIGGFLSPRMRDVQLRRSACCGNETREQFRIEVLAGRGGADHYIELRIAQAMLSGRRMKAVTELFVDWLKKRHVVIHSV